MSDQQKGLASSRTPSEADLGAMPPSPRRLKSENDLHTQPQEQQRPVSPSSQYGLAGSSTGGLPRSVSSHPRTAAARVQPSRPQSKLATSVVNYGDVVSTSTTNAASTSSSTRGLTTTSTTNNNNNSKSVRQRASTDPPEDGDHHDDDDNNDDDNDFDFSDDDRQSQQSLSDIASRPSHRSSAMMEPIRRIQSNSIYSLASPSVQSIASLLNQHVEYSVTEYNTQQQQRNPNASFRLHRLQRLLYTKGPDIIPHHDPDDPRFISRRTLEDIFVDLQCRFGFQPDNVRNQLDNMLTLLDSRCSRMDSLQAMTSIHADYIGGGNSNYRRWYSVTFGPLEYKEDVNMPMQKRFTPFTSLSFEEQQGVLSKTYRKQMKNMTSFQRARQVALWLLIWGEAGNIRFMPECICFIFKLCLDYLSSSQSTQKNPPDKAIESMKSQKLPDETIKNTTSSSPPPLEAAASGAFLEHTITPIYMFYRNQVYEPLPPGATTKLVRHRRDHVNTIGYDDINECFRDIHFLAQLRVTDGTKLLDGIQPNLRYTYIDQLQLQSTVYKTYLEKRTQSHMLTNFSRYWILHVTGFYYMAMAEAGFIFEPWKDRRDIVRWSVVALGSLLAIALSIASYCAELGFQPKTLSNIARTLWRVLVLFTLAFVNALPSVYIFWYTEIVVPRNTPEALLGGEQTPPLDAYMMAAVVTQLILSAITTLTLILVPPAFLFADIDSLLIRIPQLHNKASAVNTHKTSVERVNSIFIDNIVPLNLRDRITSFAIWLTIFGAKFAGSYTYLIRPFSTCIHDMYKYLAMCNALPADPVWGGDIFCRPVGYLGMILLLLLELSVFFLDSYLWYTVVATVASVGFNMIDGISVYSPWREIFYKLPRRMFAKLIAAELSEYPVRAKMACAEMWNAIIIALYKEHMVGHDKLSKLMYKISDAEGPNKAFVVEPRFFMAQEDSSMKTRFLPEFSEIERRLTYFGQSLCMDIPEPMSSVTMPTFTVLVPHFGEKILLSLKECITNETTGSTSTLLEYLKSLYAFEWDNFVRDSCLMQQEDTNYNKTVQPNEVLPSKLSSLVDYPAPIPPGKGTESEMKKSDSTSSDESENGNILDRMMHFVGFKQADARFTLRTRIWASLRSQTLYRTITGFMNYKRAVALQFRAENLESVTAGATTDDKLDEEADALSSRKFRLMVTMQRYQNFAAADLEAVELLFDVFRDLQIAYIEEEPPTDTRAHCTYYSVLIDGYCDKNSQGRRVPKYRVRLPGPPILGDGKADNQNHAIIFTRGEVIQVIDANQDNYLEESLKIGNLLSEFDFAANDLHSPYSPLYNGGKAPVAIVGTREHIFSAKIGPLADSAAGKEFVFGTLMQRIMTRLGSRMHYGHPDFLNYVFLTTRGGLSKAQKGLHLNEDIFAGMTAFQRGGRIKHTEYIQCGKGRDLAFASVMNFTTKLGMGVAEQTLSRELYHLGTRLPTDRFFSFFFAHTGFYINAALITLALRLMLMVTVLVAIIAHHVAAICIQGRTCVTFNNIHDWTNGCVTLIGVSLAISLLPLLLQMASENGVVRAVQRCLMHVVSLTSLFETFAVYVYSSSLFSTLSFGGAAYIATGRAVSTARTPFALLYNRFSLQGINFGLKLGLMALFASAHGFQPYQLFYWSIVAAYALSPFLFNPHQLMLRLFLEDYPNAMRWLYTGHDQWAVTSWAAQQSRERAKYTGLRGGNLRTGTWVMLVEGVLANAVFSALVAALFAYYQTDNLDRTTAILLAFAFPVAPIAVNFAVAAALAPLLCLLGTVNKTRAHAKYTAGFGYTIGVLACLAAIGFVFMYVDYNVPAFLLLCVGYTSTHAVISSLMYFCMPLEHDANGTAHMAYWSGQWRSARLRKKNMLVHFIREVFVQTLEMSRFAVDFITIHVIHLLLLPLCLVPHIDAVHTVMLMWVRPEERFGEGKGSTDEKIVKRSHTPLWMQFARGLSILVLFALCLIVVLSLTMGVVKTGKQVIFNP